MREPVHRLKLEPNLMISRPAGRVASPKADADAPARVSVKE
jgi:hypothetical protein